jgi:hypothetical protein
MTTMINRKGESGTLSANYTGSEVVLTISSRIFGLTIWLH